MPDCRATKNNAASGLMNLARNIGGSVGISFVATGLARRAQFHQVQLVEKLSAANPQFGIPTARMRAFFPAPALDPASAQEPRCSMPMP